MYIEDRSFYLECQLRSAENEARPLVSALMCKRHRRKALVGYHCDNDGVVAVIHRFCCHEFAVQVAQKLQETKRFHTIEIVDKNTVQVFPDQFRMGEITDTNLKHFLTEDL